MAIEPAAHCGHLCCDEPNNPFHDHFLSADDCPVCRRQRKEERELRERTRALSDKVRRMETLRIIPNYPRPIGDRDGHLSECFVVAEWDRFLAGFADWPPDPDSVYCTCDDWSPE